MAPPRNTLSGAAQFRAARRNLRKIQSHSIRDGFNENAPSRTCIAPLCLADPHVRSFHGHEPRTTEIGGQKVVTLTRGRHHTTKPEFTSVTLAPGRGMEILQITANFPGKGNVDVLASPDLAGAKKMLDVDDTTSATSATGWARPSSFPIPTAFAASSRPTARR
jgi:hypothetical protein